MRIVAPIVIATGGALTSTNVGTSLDPAAHVMATNYAKGAQVTEGESVYQSAVDNNSGHLPSTSGSQWWARVGSINKIAMFDSRIGSQTINANTIQTVITPPAVVDIVAARNLSAKAIAVAQAAAGYGTVYDQTKKLVEPVSNRYEYWFNEVVRKRDAFFKDLKPFRNSTVTVTIDNTGSDAKCGALFLGRSFEPGQAQYGLRKSITDYSIIKADPWGILDIVERPFSNEIEMTVWVDLRYTERFERILEERRTKPTLFIGADSRADTIVYGIPSFTKTLEYPDTDIYLVTVKGMT